MAKDQDAADRAGGARVATLAAVLPDAVAEDQVASFNAERDTPTVDDCHLAGEVGVDTFRLGRVSLHRNQPSGPCLPGRSSGRGRPRLAVILARLLVRRLVH